MTEPELAVTINGTRWYRNPNRHENAPVYRGVTGICAALPKEAIPRWAAKTVAEYAVDHIQSWWELPPADAVDLLKHVPWQQRDRAAARGTTVHTVIEKMIDGQEFTVEASVEPWVDAARRFVDDTKPDPEWMERSCFNEK
ncbi:MAG TPA: hypothetical protein VLL25_16870, partial [Acidimicrobiales bacterium]|nr:hypothetical protein [Acidimicrobiales bacterium]